MLSVHTCHSMCMEVRDNTESWLSFHCESDVRPTQQALSPEVVVFQKLIPQTSLKVWSFSNTKGKMLRCPVLSQPLCRGPKTEFLFLSMRTICSHFEKIKCSKNFSPNPNSPVSPNTHTFNGINLHITYRRDKEAKGVRNNPQTFARTEQL